MLRRVRSWNFLGILHPCVLCIKTLDYHSSRGGLRNVGWDDIAHLAGAKGAHSRSLSA